MQDKLQRGVSNALAGNFPSMLGLQQNAPLMRYCTREWENYRRARRAA
jgi:hypothetical protein